jgi:hypothetical protein
MIRLTDLPGSTSYLFREANLTAEVLARLESLCKLRAHLDLEVPGSINPLSTSLDLLVNNLLEVVPVYSVKHIAEPFPVQVNPVSFVGDVFEVLRILSEDV